MQKTTTLYEEVKCLTLNDWHVSLGAENFLAVEFPTEAETENLFFYFIVLLLRGYIFIAILSSV